VNILRLCHQNNITINFLKIVFGAPYAESQTQCFRSHNVSGRHLNACFSDDSNLPLQHSSQAQYGLAIYWEHEHARTRSSNCMASLTDRQTLPYFSQSMY